MTNCLPPQITEQNHWSSPDWIRYGYKDALQLWLPHQIKQLVPTERWDQLSPKIKSSVWKYCHDCRQITWRDFCKMGNQINYKVNYLVKKWLDFPYVTSLSFFCIHFLIVFSPIGAGQKHCSLYFRAVLVNLYSYHWCYTQFGLFWLANSSGNGHYLAKNVCTVIAVALCYVALEKRKKEIVSE